MAADMIELVTATGKSTDPITNQLIPEGTPCAKLTINSRCAFYTTAESLRLLAAEINRIGSSLLYRSGDHDPRPARWPQHNRADQRRVTQI